MVTEKLPKGVIQANKIVDDNIIIAVSENLNEIKKTKSELMSYLKLVISKNNNYYRLHLIYKLFMRCSKVGENK